MNWESFKLGSKNNSTIISSYQSSYCYHQSKSQKGCWDIVLSQQKTFVCCPGKYSISQNTVLPYQLRPGHTAHFHIWKSTFLSIQFDRGTLLQLMTKYIEDKHALSYVSTKLWMSIIQVLSTLTLTPLPQGLTTSEGCLQPVSVHDSWVCRVLQECHSCLASRPITKHS